MKATQFQLIVGLLGFLDFAVTAQSQHLTATEVGVPNLIDTTYGAGAGGFELPGITNDQDYVTLPSPSQAITGWTVDFSQLDWASKAMWNPAQGSHSIDLNGQFTPGGLSTTVPTAVGELYRVCFEVSGFRASGSPSQFKRMEVTAGTSTNFTYTLDAPIVPDGIPLPVIWNKVCFDFVATATTTTLGFKSLEQTDASGLLLDNVSVELLRPEVTIRVAEVEVCWTSRADWSYVVQYRSELTTNLWTNLTAPIRGTGTNNCILDPTPHGQPQRYYRVQTLP